MNDDKNRQTQSAADADIINEYRNFSRDKAGVPDGENGDVPDGVPDGEKPDTEKVGDVFDGAENVDGEKVDGAENADDGQSAPRKRKKRGIERHLYPCPHCGEQILDHFTSCPKCGGEVKPRGYHVDEQKRKKVVRACEIAGAVISVALVILIAVLTNI